VGYVSIMAGIGYVTWWLRVRKISTNRRKKQQESDSDALEMSCRAETTGTVRFSEIEERQALTTTSNSHGHSNSR
jgi:hypothetical protein